MKSVMLKMAKVGGIFALCSAATSDRLRILCYHGISQVNEHEMAPGTFMRAETFERRMNFLKKWGANVLDLSEGLARLRSGTLPNKAVVITVDDGFWSSYAYMIPTLEKLDLPATVYVSTYYVVNQRPLDNLMTHYPTGLSEAECRARRVMMFMNLDEVRDLERRGFDVQLHTHRHRFPLNDRRCADREIRDNMAVLGSRKHFCYPSGVHSTQQAKWLADAGIESATTTDFGLATRWDSPFALPRICDSEAMSQPDFEAALCGFKDLFFGARRRGRTTIV